MFSRQGTSLTKIVSISCFACAICKQCPGWMKCVLQTPIKSFWIHIFEKEQIHYNHFDLIRSMLLKVAHPSVHRLTTVPNMLQSVLPLLWEGSVKAQKLHWTGKDSCLSASSPYFFPGTNTDTVWFSRTEKRKLPCNTLLQRHTYFVIFFPPPFVLYLTE